GPALRERQRAGAERPAFPLPFPWLARGLDAVARQARAKGWHEHRAHAIWAARHRLGLRVNEQRIADVVPGEGDFLAARHCPLGPEIARIAGLAEFGVGHRDRRIQQLRIEHALDCGLQPARHGDVVGPDAPALLGQLALEIEHVPRSGRREDDAPEAGVGRVVVTVGGAEPDEGVLARYDHDVGVCSAHRSGLHPIPAEVGIRRRSGQPQRRATSRRSIAAWTSSVGTRSDLFSISAYNICISICYGLILVLWRTTSCAKTSRDTAA